MKKYIYFPRHDNKAHTHSTTFSSLRNDSVNGVAKEEKFQNSLRKLYTTMNGRGHKRGNIS